MTLSLRTISSGLAIVLPALGCRAASAPPPILSIVPEIATAIDAQRAQPEYLDPRDSLTASVLSELARGRGYKLGRPASEYVCPWSRADAPKGYFVEISVEPTNRDLAEGRWEIGCHDPNRRFAFRHGGWLRLGRVGKTWKILDARGWIT